jgi:hypothetical protein
VAAEEDTTLLLAKAYQVLVDLGASREWAVEAVRIALHGHCLNRDCLRGSSAGNSRTARFNHLTIHYDGCECTCSICEYGREQARRK